MLQISIYLNSFKKGKCLVTEKKVKGWESKKMIEKLINGEITL